MNNNCLSILSQSAAMVALCGAASGAFAHNSITPSSVTEGASSYHNMVIGHGCKDANDNPVFPIIAESTAFPDLTSTDATHATLTFADNAGSPLGDKGQDHTAFFEFSTHSGTGGGLQAIQSNDVFDKNTVIEKTSPVVSAKFTTVGYSYTKGKLPANINGLVPFKIDTVKIKNASCVTKVVFKVAVADICKKTPISGFDAASVNLWTPDYGTTSKFSGFYVTDPQTGQPVWSAENALPAFTINRDTAKNPYQSNQGGTTDCTNAANQFSVTVTPSKAQLDRDLPISKYWGQK